MSVILLIRSNELFVIVTDHANIACDAPAANGRLTVEIHSFLCARS